jgi:hypothetical protein
VYSSSILAKWSGPAAMLAGVLFAAWGFLPDDSASQRLAIAQRTLGTIVPLLLLLGLAGLRARCVVGRAGWLGRAGIEAGFVRGFVALVWGGVLRPFVDMTALYRYLLSEGWPPWFSNWIAWFVVSLIVIGLAASATKATRDYGVLALTVGLLGWLYFSTNSGGVIETHLGHVTLGGLFCLSWIALGYALWKDAGLKRSPVGAGFSKAE